MFYLGLQYRNKPRSRLRSRSSRNLFQDMQDPPEKSCIIDFGTVFVFFLDVIILIICILSIALISGICFHRSNSTSKLPNFNKTIQDEYVYYENFGYDLSPQTAYPLSNKEIWHYIAKIPHVTEVDCEDFLVPPEEWTSTLEELSQLQPAAESVPRSDYRDCDLITSSWMDMPVSEFERRNPIAFSIMVYTNVDRVLRVLRAVYRRSNVYCIHVDDKSPLDFKEKISNISTCFENVFVTEENVKVEWGTSAVLEQEMICLKELWRRQLRWNWLINLTGEEFPLKTNLELVHILSIMRGFNDIWVDPCSVGHPKSSWSGCRKATFTKFQERWRKSAAPPFFVQPYKGQVHAVLSRRMVDFILHDDVARDIYNWSLTSIIADEVFFSTLNNNVHVRAPGSTEFAERSAQSIARLKLWKIFSKNQWPYCNRYLRLVCLLTPRELPLLTNSKFLFANKFKPEERPLGYACLEQWYFTRVVNELREGRVQIDLRPYYRMYYTLMGF